jgi:hypothetical protein
VRNTIIGDELMDAKSCLLNPHFDQIDRVKPIDWLFSYVFSFIFFSSRERYVAGLAMVIHDNYGQDLKIP